jgi:hypothetical protein
MSYEYEGSHTTHHRTAFWALTLAPGLTLLPVSIDATEAYATPAEKLVHGGVMDNISVSRPEKIIGEIREISPKSSANSLLKYAGTWAGNDLEQRLEEVYLSRGEAEF